MLTIPTETSGVLITVTEAITNQSRQILTLDTTHAVLSESKGSLAKTMSTGMKSECEHFHLINDGERRRRRGEGEDGRGMAGRWSRGWEEYEPCGIGLTSHSLPSAAQDM